LNMVRAVVDSKIKDAMFSIDDDKASGPDSFTLKIFKSAWSVVGSDVCVAVKEFFSSEGLSDLIDPNQSAFILDRQISDNILLSQEFMRGYDWKCSVERQIRLDDRALDEFSMISRLYPSMVKSRAFFGNVHEDVKEHIHLVMPFSKVDIYTLINHYQTAKKIWDCIKELMEGTKITKQERESMLYDEFDKFTSEPGESIHLYYSRYSNLINDMKINPMSMSNMQINTKFVNHLQPEWSRFVTTAKQARDLHSVNFNHLYAFLKHNEKDAKEVQEMRQRFLKPLALLANTYNLPPSYSSQ
nr:hypothetical protein [Tanacetum cinerariifolium]